MNRILLTGLAALLLAACATGGPSFDTQKADMSLLPRQAVAEPEQSAGKSVLWGGVIVNTTNLEDHSQVEILAYPLGSRQRPELDEAPLGRFLAIYPGYLEPVDYAQGRVVTVFGELAGNREGMIGESRYIYPVTQTRNIYLWPRTQPRTSPQLHFGIGVIFSD